MLGRPASVRKPIGLVFVIFWRIIDVAAKKDTCVKKCQCSAPKNGVQYSQSEFYECLRSCACLDSRKIAKSVYAAMAEMIQASLKKGYKIPLPGIGKIQVRQTKPRIGRNPATGEPIRIPAKKRVRLTPSKALKDAVLK
ncbi:MAG: HU family DNA-binding protein [Deltaproteobacteria bacterium]|nr:HU family DNA-binding protein [Deltaproteobacteria bacterium]